MSGFLGSLLGSNDQTVTTQTSGIRPQAEQLAGQFLTATQQFAAQPYQAYKGTREAAFTPDQLAAFESARGIGTRAGDIYGQMAGALGASNVPANIQTMQQLAGGVGGTLPASQALLPGQVAAAQQAGALAGMAPGIVQQSVPGTLGLAQTFPNVNIQSYMNPFVEAALQPALEDVARRADVERNALRSQQARTGAFGGSRGAVAEQELERNVQNEIGRLSSTGRFQAFNEAANQFRLDQQRIPELYSQALGQLGAAQGLQRGAADITNQALAGQAAVQSQGLTAQQALGNVAAAEAQRQGMLQNLAGANLGLMQTQVNPLLATGGLQQALSQSGLDRAYQDFIEQRDWQTRGLAAQRAALGLPGATSSGVSTTTVNPPNANPYGQVIGGTLGILSALGSSNVQSGLSGIGGVLGDAGNYLWKGAKSVFGFKQGGLIGLANQ
jgi:hypothetical protein